MKPSYQYYSKTKHVYDPICTSCTADLEALKSKPIKMLMGGQPIFFCSEKCLKYYSSHPALEVTKTMIKYNPKKAMKHFNHEYSSFY